MSSNLGANLLGIWGTIFIHEGGHALTAKALGWDVQRFRPFPSRLEYRKADGTIERHWAAGYIMADTPSPITPELRAKEFATISLMGTGASTLAALLLPPLLPHMKGFGVSVLNDMLVACSFDAPLYIGSALFEKWFMKDVSGFNDWAVVQKQTGVALEWWFLGSIATSALLFGHQRHFRDSAIRRGHFPASDLPAKIGLSFSFQ